MKSLLVALLVAAACATVAAASGGTRRGAAAGSDAPGHAPVQLAPDSAGGEAFLFYRERADEYGFGYVHAGTLILERVSAIGHVRRRTSVMGTGGGIFLAAAYDARDDTYLVASNDDYNPNAPGAATRIDLAVVSGDGARVTPSSISAPSPPGHVTTYPRLLYNSRRDEFLLSWTACETQSSDLCRVYGEVLSPAGAVISPPIALVGADLEGPPYALAANQRTGAYLLAWSGSRSFARTLTPSGAAASPPHRLRLSAGQVLGLTFDSRRRRFLLLAQLVDVQHRQSFVLERLNEAGRIARGPVTIRQHYPLAQDVALLYVAPADQVIVAWEGQDLPHGASTFDFPLFQRLSRGGATRLGASIGLPGADSYGPPLAAFDPRRRRYLLVPSRPSRRPLRGIYGQFHAAA